MKREESADVDGTPPRSSARLKSGDWMANGRPAVSTASLDGVEAAEAVPCSPDTRLKPGANEKPTDFLLWQLADSAFPTGGFAHSAGLEAAWQHGEVRNPAELRSWLDTSLAQLAHAALPFVNAAHAEPHRLAEFDQHCDAFTRNHVANRASRLQGKALLAAVERVFNSELRTPNSESPPFAHLAPIFGAATRSLDIPRATAVRLFVFMHLRSAIAAAVRLNIVGPMEGQSIQHRLVTKAEAIAHRGDTLTLDDLAQTAPLLDLWQGAHDRLYSRLFQT